MINLRYQSNNILARDKVLYFGHAVAAVAATSLHIAEEALELIQVDYEMLPPVLDVLQAMRADAPVLLDDLRMNEIGRRKATGRAISPNTSSTSWAMWSKVFRRRR